MHSNKLNYIQTESSQQVKQPVEVEHPDRYFRPDFSSEGGPAPPEGSEDPRGQHGVVFRVDGLATEAVQGIPYLSYVNAESAGSRGISLSSVTIPVGRKCVPHFHPDTETVIFLIRGTVRTRYGDDLDQEVILHEGQALYIGAGVPHVAENIGSTPAIAISALTTAQEQDRTVPYWGPVCL